MPWRRETFEPRLWQRGALPALKIVFTARALPTSGLCRRLAPAPVEPSTLGISACEEGG